MTVRIGLLGASRIAESAVIGPAAELGHRVVAVAARDRSRAAVFAEKYAVERVLDGYQAVIDDAEVDVVYNPLANSQHAPWNLAAIAAGKPVLSEKPFARDQSEAQRVADAADAAGVTVLEGFHYFFHPVTQRAFELTANGTLGTITHVEVRMAMPTPGDDDPRWSLELAGGALMDLGCYGLHVMRSLGRLGVPGIEGHPSVVRAHAEERTPGVDASCDVEIGFPGGATGLSTHSMIDHDHSYTIRIIGTAGDLMVHDFVRPKVDDRLTIHTSAGTVLERLGTRSSYTYQLDAFASHVEHGTPLPFGTADAVANMALVDAAYRAADMEPR